MNISLLRKRALEASSALRVLALVGAGAAATTFAAPAMAQDYTSGGVNGTVTDNNGAALGGATVTLRSIAQGQTRTLVADGSGSFTASGLTPGDYSVNVAAKGFAPYAGTITISPAQESRVSVELVNAGANPQIIVTGSRLRQTQTQAATGLALDVPAITRDIAIPRSVTGVTLLAPTTARGNTGFGDVPSIGGGSVAENAYYINGLNITNPDTYVGSAAVPFEFYKTVDVQTGGYPAEFGRATGGVINATTKSGTNIPFIAAHFNWRPQGLQGFSPNTGDPKTPSTIGRLRKVEDKSATLEAGGAIIPDHLFIYGLIEGQRHRSTSASATAGTYETITNNDPFYGLKVDGYITPTQHAELTIFDTRSTDHISDYAFTPNATLTGGTIGASKGTELEKLGGFNYVGRYTGDVTDWFTLSAAYGVSKDRDDVLPADTNSYYVIDRRTATTGGLAKVVSQQPFPTQSIDETRRRFYRGDADLRFSAAGQHHIRMGFDNEDLSETKIFQVNGAVAPVLYDYRNTGVRITYEHLGGQVSGRDTAYYIQDSWTTPVDGLTINVGLRDDLFKQTNLSGQQYLSLTNNFGPRASFSYSPPGLDRFKFFGSYGRYFIPPAMNLGFRGRDLYFREYYNYPAGYTAATFPIDPTTGLPAVDVGAPRLGVPGYNGACPASYPTAPGHPTQNGTLACAVFGPNVQDPALAKVAPNTKATYEDEFILGGRFNATNLLSVGLTATYRKLKRVSEDTDFAPYLANYFCGTGNGGSASTIDATRCNYYNSSAGTYYIWNPGKASATLVDWYGALSGQSKLLTLTGLQFPKPVRTYTAVVLDFVRRDDSHWFASGSVTWSRSKGNTEGTVKSDAGNVTQSDAGSTQDFDYLGLTDYSYGLLPNDHRWQFKMFGAYHFNSIFTLGANVLVQSPNHESCEGIHPTDTNAAAYGPSSFFCGNGKLDANGDYTGNVPSPRGTGLQTNWLKQVDLSARANIPFGGSDLRHVTLRADVFNVFNSHAIIQRNIANETGAGTNPGSFTPDPLYGLPQAYQTPRYFRFGLDLSWGGAPAPAPAYVAPPVAPLMHTCADGTVINAEQACPVAPPPPPSTKVCADGTTVGVAQACPVPPPPVLPRKGERG